MTEIGGRECAVSTKALFITMAPVFVCEICWKRVKRDDGYLCVNLIEVIRHNRGRVNWRIYHRACDPDPKPTDYRIWAQRFSDACDLMEVMADLSDQTRWFSATNWSGLLRRVLADTRRYADEHGIGKPRPRKRDTGQNASEATTPGVWSGCGRSPGGEWVRTAG